MGSRFNILNRETSNYVKVSESEPHDSFNMGLEAREKVKEKRKSNGPQTQRKNKVEGPIREKGANTISKGNTSKDDISH